MELLCLQEYLRHLYPAIPGGPHEVGHAMVVGGDAAGSGAAKLIK
jgi:hypothetical protein